MNDHYRVLAERLDDLPNGYPATESGVELRLLRRVFTPDEAQVAAAMTDSLELADQIASRAGLEVPAALGLLKAMTRKGLIRARPGRGALTFGLIPFVVGFWEAQLPRLDATLAALYEEYLVEVAPRLLGMAPSLQRVIPVGKAIRFELEVLPFESAREILSSAQAWGVRDCICRKQRALIGQGCEAPMESCLTYAPVAHAFDHDTATRAISLDESLRLLSEAEDAGLVHTTANHQQDAYYICNCCPCCCGILRGLTEFGQPGAMARSGYRAAVDVEACAACGACEERCAFGAISYGAQGVAAVDAVRCIGCGLCVSTCPTGALRLDRRADWSPPPPSPQAWGEERLKQRRALSGAEETS